MKTVDRPSQLQTLGERLQAALQGDTPIQPPIQVRCGLKQGTLLVLAQHPTVLPEPPHIFALLEATLRALPPAAIEGWNQSPFPVRLYLRVEGQQQPYAVQAFTLEPKAAAAEEPSGQLIHLPAVTALEAHEPLAADEVEELADWEAPVASWLSRLPMPLVALTAAIGLTAFTGSLYALTRPCVLGGCAPLQQAEQLSQTAAETVETTTSAPAIVDAYDQLVEASYLLGTIPPWSQYYEAAQARRQSYEAQTQGLTEVVAALRQAMSAAQRSQNPPHPFGEWQEIQTVWRQAIARLEQIPADSPVHDLAQRKLEEYRANLASINQRVAIERQAQEKVNTARSTARIAEARGGVAASLEGWQLTHATWQTVVNLLQQVPQTTMAHAEAQQLLAIYQPKLAAARDRRTQEEISATTYNQAIDLANRARRSERQNQWTDAVEQWRDALDHAQQVPNSSSYYSQAQPLINAYTAALAQAEDTKRVTIAMQSATDALSRTCAGTLRICEYTFANNAIRVSITPEYDRAVEQAMVRTQATGDYYTQAEFTAHVNSLLRALAAISENANIPIELYNSDGSLFGTYEPEFSGYVAR